MTTTDLVTAAASVAGLDAVRAATQGVAPVDGVLPRIVVAPNGAEAAAATLAWATRERLSVMLSGHGTKVQWGRPPSPIDVELNFSKLDRVLEHQSSDLTATVEAGAVIDDVNRVLGQAGQRLAIDPPFSARATIGGVIATNDSGPLRHRYGTPRDQIIGITFATVDGEIARAGGKVVKNVAGYDLSKLLCGSHGALAAILSATFKLTPVPAATATVILPDAPPEMMAAAVADIHALQLEPMALEVDADITPREDRRGLLVRFGSVQASVAAAVDDMRAIASRLGHSAVVVAGAEETALWHAHAAKPFAEAHAVVRLSWLPGDLVAVIGALREVSAQTGVALAWTGRVAVGAGLLSLAGTLAEQAAAVSQLRQRRVIGHVVVVRASLELRAQVDPWGSLPDYSRLWAPLKQMWDPRATLGAGRGPL